MNSPVRLALSCPERPKSLLLITPIHIVIAVVLSVRPEPVPVLVLFDRCNDDVDTESDRWNNPRTAGSYNHDI